MHCENHLVFLLKCILCSLSFICTRICNSATPHWMVCSYYIIAHNIYFTAQDESSLDSLIPIIEAFHWFATKQILSFLGSRLLIFECEICKTIFFENIPFGIAMFFAVGRNIAFGRHSCFITVIKWESIQRNFVIIHRSWTWVDVYVTWKQ